MWAMSVAESDRTASLSIFVFHELFDGNIGQLPSVRARQRRGRGGGTAASARAQAPSQEPGGDGYEASRSPHAHCIGSGRFGLEPPS